MEARNSAFKKFNLVENTHYLNDNYTEEDGLAISILDIDSIHHWTKEEIEAACASYWDKGYFAWVISNVRPIRNPIKVIAKRKIYDLDVVI